MSAFYLDDDPAQDAGGKTDAANATRFESKIDTDKIWERFDALHEQKTRVMLRLTDLKLEIELMERQIERMNESEKQVT